MIFYSISFFFSSLSSTFIYNFFIFYIFFFLVFLMFFVFYFYLFLSSLKKKKFFFNLCPSLFRHFSFSSQFFLSFSFLFPILMLILSPYFCQMLFTFLRILFLYFCSSYFLNAYCHHQNQRNQEGSSISSSSYQLILVYKVLISSLLPTNKRLFFPSFV